MDRDDPRENLISLSKIPGAYDSPRGKMIGEQFQPRCLIQRMRCHTDLKVAQLERRRRLADDVSGVLQGARGLALALSCDHLGSGLTSSLSLRSHSTLQLHWQTDILPAGQGVRRAHSQIETNSPQALYEG